MSCHCPRLKATAEFNFAHPLNFNCNVAPVYISYTPLAACRVTWIDSANQAGRLIQFCTPGRRVKTARDQVNIPIIHTTKDGTRPLPTPSQVK